MKVKLDENLGSRIERVFTKAGHEVSSVRMQGLSGESDERIFDVCRSEERVLVTLDHDFGNLLRFPVEEVSGVVILESPVPTSGNVLASLAEHAAQKVRGSPIHGRLWIIQPGRIRERPAWADDENS